MYSEKTEEDIKKYWENNNIIDKVRSKESDKYYYFIDGPPYASGTLHLGTIMNRVLKDIIIRYKRMKGYNVLDTPGFDTHGVPIEIKVQKKYNLKSKEDIEAFGVENFIKECKSFATQHIESMSKSIFDFGQWMDWEHPYKTLDKNYIETAWWTFKKATDKGLLYHGKYPVHVCPKCETAVSFNEIEHKDLTDTSIYVKIQSYDDPNTFYIIWTTTPWTLPANMGIMVHPKYKYIELIDNGKKYIVAKDLVEKLVKEFNLENYSLGNEFFGEELKDKKYIPVLGDWINLSDEDKERAYRIVLSPRYVHLEDGTGLVHCAPGHGREDYLVGKENNLPAFCPVTITGTYDENVPSYKGRKVKEMDPEIIDYLDSKGMLIFKKKITHSYPTCWRCHSPLLQVSLPQWFLKIEPMKERLKEINKKEVKWYPSWAKDRFDNWLDSISDWPISRSRYWGIPLPIWKCNKCGKIEVFGSLEELKQKVPNLDLNMDPHKPYIDEIKFSCDCGGTYERVPEITDVWFDSGVASWASIGYPNKKELFDKYWPPDINIEGSDQIRGWWNSQLICSTICFDRAPYKFVALHGMVLDVNKRKLSKSEGNDKPLNEWITEYSRDFIRYYFAKEYQGTDLSIDQKKFKEVKRTLGLLENIFNFLKLYDSEAKFIQNITQEKLTVEDRWIISKFQSLLELSNLNYNSMSFGKFIADVDKFILEDLSRMYIKIIRKRKNKNKVLSYILSGLLLLLSPIIPHFTEYLYLKFKDSKESIHLKEIPNVNKDLIDKKLENNFDVAQNIIQATLSLREEISKRLRWVLPKLVIKVKKDNGLSDLKEIISNLSNIKEIVVTSEEPQGNYKSKEITEELVVYLDLDIPESFKEIWELSELTRLLQSERKKKNLNPSDKVTIDIACDDIEFLKRNKEKIQEITNTNMNILDISKLVEDRRKLVEREISFLFLD